MGHHGAPRLESFPYRGLRAYSVTCCTFSRVPWFDSGRVVWSVAGDLLVLAATHAYDVAAYCFMPDHVHLLLEAPSIDSDLRRLMSAWKQKTGYAHERAMGSRLWQNGYYDHVLRRDEDRLRMIGYLLANPLRAGLAADIREYPFWGSSVWTREELLEAVEHLMPSRAG